MKNFGFTLAEVLITLGIIGVVAALTISSVINNHQKKTSTVKLKQTYSIMSQAITQAQTDFGPIKDWSFDTNFVDKYIKPYYKSVKEFDDLYTIYCRNGGECLGYGNFPASKKIIIANGALLAFHPLSNSNGQNTMTIIADINGHKRPNKYGRDVFMFNIDSNKGIIPYGTGMIAGQLEALEINRDYLLNGPDYRVCNKHGLYCAAVIMYDGWEIRADYKW